MKLKSFTILTISRTFRPGKFKGGKNQAHEIEFNEFLGNGASIEGGEFDRVLGAVRKKLSKELTVETEVWNLIHQASDPDNLALMFRGMCILIFETWLVILTVNRMGCILLIVYIKHL